MISIALLNLAMYASSARWAAGRTRKVVGGGGNWKSIIFPVSGGQQFVGAAPVGRSAGPHFVTSGPGTGAAKASGEAVRAVAPYSPPSPISTSRLSNLAGDEDS